MSACADCRVLFRVAAGPRTGFGHLLRARSLARALGVRPLVSVRGASSVDVALAMGCDVIAGKPSPRRLLARLQPDVLIVDDPVARAARQWIRAARACGVAVASIHDLGIGCREADLLIDGSVITTLGESGAAARSARRARRTARVARFRGRAPLVNNGATRSSSRRVLAGPDFAIVDPALTQAAQPLAARRGVVVSLGGGPRAEVAWAVAAEIARRAPDVDVRVVGGFVSNGPPSTALHARPANLTWIRTTSSLAKELGRARVAVVGGGVSLYEACALGTPAVGVAVVNAQRPTVAAFVARGAALGRARLPVTARRVADQALRLLREERLHGLVSRRARRLVDGRGAVRAATAIARLVEGR